MRKVANIMMLLNGIFAIIGAAYLFLGGVMLILGGTPLFANMIREMIESGAAHSDFTDDPEQLLRFAQVMLIICGSSMILATAPSIVLAIISFKTRTNYSRGHYLAVIILSAILDIAFGIVGGIFGLIANRKAPKPQPEVEVVDVK